MNSEREKTQINVCISKTEQEKNNWNFLVKRWRKREKRIRSLTTDNCIFAIEKNEREQKVILRKPKEWRMQFANGKLRYKLQECFFSWNQLTKLNEMRLIQSTWFSFFKIRRATIRIQTSSLFIYVFVKKRKSTQTHVHVQLSTELNSSVDCKRETKWWKHKKQTKLILKTTTKYSLK